MVSQVSGLVENGVFTDTINAINVKLCMLVLLTELYLFIPLSVTLTIFQGQHCSYPVKLKLCKIVKLVKVDNESTTIFHFCTCWREISSYKNLNIGFLVDTIWGRFSNFVWGLAIHVRFDDFDPISRSQICQNYKLQIAF